MKLKILILGEVNSSHLNKWANSIVRSNGGTNEVLIFSLSKSDPLKCEYDERVRIIAGKNKQHEFLGNILQLRKIVKRYEPDIIHAHYASSYGLLGALTGWHPFIISAWGSDIMEFPRKSMFHRLLLQYNLKKADFLTATSRTLREEIRKYTNKDVDTIAFGIDLERFKQATNDMPGKDRLVVGTIRWLEKTYGIDTLIRAFTLLREQRPDLDIELRVVGDGPERDRLGRLCRELGVQGAVRFIGYVPPEETWKYHQQMSVFVALSRRESFGVAVLEASACGKPVVASDIGGLREVVVPGFTGFLVPPDSPREAAEAIGRLIENPALRAELGRNGRKWVEEKYDWKKNVQEMIEMYRKALKG
jgi:glycosyltransferase involved in cell wall biosynthesis